MKKLLTILKDFLSNTLHFSIVTNLIKNKNTQINTQGGCFVQTNTVVDLSTKESAEEFANQITKFVHEHLMVDVHNSKFKYYLNQSILILQLNDSVVKRVILKDLLLKKFSGEEQGVDDSDASTTIALDAMRYLTDTTLKRLCAFRLLTNVVPSIVNAEKYNLLSEALRFIHKNGLMDKAEIMNLRRLGIIYEMTDTTYSLDEIKNLQDVVDLIHLDNLDESLILSSSLSLAGITLTDIMLQYFLSLNGPFSQWLPVNNKSLHLKGLIVDEDIIAMRNIAAQGEVSANTLGAN